MLLDQGDETNAKGNKEHSFVFLFSFFPWTKHGRVKDCLFENWQGIHNEGGRNRHSCCGRKDFFGSVSGSYISVGSDPYPDSKLIFSKILYINFTVVFPPCKGVRLHIILRYKQLSEIFSDKKDFFIFKLYIFVDKLSYFISFSELFYFKFISDPELPGSGFCYKFRVRPDPDPQHW